MADVMDTPPALSPSGDDRLWGAVAHLSALAMYFTAIGHILGPLVVWLWKRDDSRFAGTEAREALNFNISLTIYDLIVIAAGMALAIPLVLLLHVFSFLVMVFLLIPVLGVLHLGHIVLIIVAGLKAADGKPFRYPFTMRLVN